MHEAGKSNAIRILFVCYGNACRSQMAEALANRMGGGKIRAYSAGTHPLGAIPQDTRAVLREKGISLSGHWSKGLKDVPVSKMDMVVKMGLAVKFRPPPDFKGRLVQWHVPDPYTLDQGFYRDVCSLIESEVRRLLADLARETGHSKDKTGSSKLEIRNSNLETPTPKRPE